MSVKMRCCMATEEVVVKYFLLNIP